MSKKVFLSLLIVFLSINGALAEEYLPSANTNDIQNYSSNITTQKDPFAKAPGLNSPDLSQIEISLFGKAYNKQGLSARLARIEKSLFNTTYPNSPNQQRIDNIISNFNQINKYPNISRASLSKIENQLFNQKYPMNNPQRRIERIEENLFGAVQSGDLNSRLNNIQHALIAYSSKNYNTTQNPYYAETIPRRGLSKWFGNSILGGGMMTGFTPNIMPFSNVYGNNFPPVNSPVYNNSGYNPYENFGTGYTCNGQMNRCNRGYYNSNSNVNTGMGVTILD